MSFGKPLAERERALEDAFFRKEDARLLEKMRQKQAHDADAQALAEALGMSDQGIIESLLEAGLRASNVAALMLAPLVAVAWADHKLDNEERQQLLRAEHDLGIDPESDAGQLFATWLSYRPHPQLFDAWSAYARELGRVLEPAERDRIATDIRERARHIAHAIEKTFLRGGGTTSVEEEVLEQIDKVFAHDAE